MIAVAQPARVVAPRARLSSAAGGLPAGGEAVGRFPPPPGIPRACLPGLCSAPLGWAPRLRSHYGRLQQVPHRAPLRHCRRRCRRLRASLPAQQAAGGSPVWVSGEGRGRRATGAQGPGFWVRGAGGAPGAIRGASAGRPRQAAVVVALAGSRPGKGAAYVPAAS